MPVTNPNLLTPFADPQKVVIYSVIKALNPLLATYTDEIGKPVNMILRDAATKELVGYPSIVINVDGGEIPEMNGNNLVTEDDNGIYYYEVSYIGAMVHVSIEARLALERERLMGFLIGGMHSFAVNDQNTIPSVVPEAVQTSMAANGVWVRSTQDIAKPDPIPSDPRVADTIYKASFTWRCDVSLQWTLTGVTLSALEVSTTVNSGNQSRTTDITVGS